MSTALDVSVRLTRPAFDLDVMLEIPVGITALFGPSGSGKTTIANIIAGIDRPDHGRISIDGRTMLDTAEGISLRPEARKTGYVFQESLLFPHLTVEQNIRYGGPGTKVDSRFEELVKLLDLQPLLKRYPARLSGGEARRVAIARALVAGPHVLILDEPMTGLDPSRRHAFYPYLERLLAEAGMPVLYITHQVEEIMRLADRAVLVTGGKVLATGSPEELSRHPEARAFMGEADPGVIMAARVVGQSDGLTELQVAGGTLRTTTPAEDLRAQTRLRIGARDVAIARVRPADTSILNILECRIRELATVSSGEVEVLLELSELPADGPETLIARVTAASQKRLALQPGETVYALIKAVAVARSTGPDVSA